jgi:hypothetical protein
MERHVPDASDWLILAMIDHRRGRAAEARQHLERAQKQLASAKATDPDVSALAGEVAKLLGQK